MTIGIIQKYRRWFKEKNSYQTSINSLNFFVFVMFEGIREKYLIWTSNYKKGFDLSK